MLRQALPAVIVAGLSLLGLAPAAGAVSCENTEFDDNRFTVCTVDATTEELGLYRAKPDGAPYGHFTFLDQALADEGKTLVFGMNAGMYHDDRSPVGHYVENGREEMRVIASAGPGNFGLLPNGVFCIADDSARVFETGDFLKQAPSCNHATQSGPMLVIDGKLHPRFLPDSTSRYIRNGVGTTQDGSRAVFVISQNTVTFHEFARFFRDGLQLPNALFLDGNISRLYAPELGRNDLGRRMGPIVAVTKPLD
ncbi:phosphodiester glycosidase family protein [Sagittula sp. SSi028]|uniref:phosphodiester glycosidase family protein n=1 Tax=Sagittula sp. SSi028 TaxID=3400636 RepID=UPI003AF458C0